MISCVSRIILVIHLLFYPHDIFHLSLSPTLHQRKPLGFLLSTSMYLSLNLKVMLMSALKVLVKNPVKKKIMGKEKKTINVLTVFFISHKSDVKTFFN